MAALTQIEFAEQMVAQLRLLKPSISAEVGTPERLIIDTVAKSLADSSVDLGGLQQALNVDTKFGSNLTNFLSIFGFSRQQSASATGFVIFSRNTEANVDILIPAGTIVKSHISVTVDGLLPEFVTTAAVTLTKGTKETPLCPVRCLKPGIAGNVPANAITIMTLAPVLGITAVTNPSATTGGADQEGDNELKIRFKNTVFRNLAGTEDSYLALAVATAFSEKATVIGPISKYKEYFQVPGISGSLTGDDTTAYAYGGAGSAAISGETPNVLVKGSGEIGSNLLGVATAGMLANEAITIWTGAKNPEKAFVGTIKEVKNASELVLSGILKATVKEGWVQVGKASGTFTNQWTSALSINPYIKNIWPSLPVFVSTYQSGLSKFFFREGVDFIFNLTSKLQGDTLRALIDGVGLDPRSDVIGKTQPNVTFNNVYLGSEEPNTALAPGQVVLVEYAYTSTASRNSIEHNVTNAVDVYVNGANEQPTSTIFSLPLAANQLEFADNPTSIAHYENYRRDGEPTKRPIVNNYFIPLYQEPIISIPSQIIVGKNIYYKGVHYWLVHDVSTYGGSIRSRDGIEWSKTTPGDESGLGRPISEAIEAVQTGKKEEPEYTGTKFGSLAAYTPVEVTNYIYDANIADLQAAIEGTRQITTDALAHRARTRYFKFDLTVVYASQATPAVVNEEIKVAIEHFFGNQWFGSVVRLSDILQVVHNVIGVENVRWSNDVPNTRNKARVVETDNTGLAVAGVFVDRVQWGRTSPATKEIQLITIVGNPTEGGFRFKKTEAKANSSKELPFTEPITASKIQAALVEVNEKVGGGFEWVVTEDVRSTTGVTQPIKSFKAVQTSAELRPLHYVTYNTENPVGGGEFIFNSDFFLRDNELPSLPAGSQTGDTLPGLIIRSRAENVWTKG